MPTPSPARSSQGWKRVRDAQRAGFDLGRRQQRLLHAGREPEILFQRFLRPAQAVLGEPPRGDVGLDPDEVRDLAGARRGRA